MPKPVVTHQRLKLLGLGWVVCVPGTRIAVRASHMLVERRSLHVARRSTLVATGSHLADCAAPHFVCRYQCTMNRIIESPVLRNGRWKPMEAERFILACTFILSGKGSDGW